MGQNFILKIYQHAQTVFSTKELSLIFPQTNFISLKNKLSYAVKTGKLVKLRKGIYAKTKYNFLEVVSKIYAPSYISLETVLATKGIIFQKYENLFAISYLTRSIKVANREIFYRKIKDKILLNKIGIIEKDNYFIASKERAFLDAVFLYKDYHFDNLKPIDWEKIEEIKKIYTNKAFEKRILDYFKIYQNEDVK